MNFGALRNVFSCLNKKNALQDEVVSISGIESLSNLTFKPDHVKTYKKLMIELLNGVAANF